MELPAIGAQSMRRAMRCGMLCWRPVEPPRDEGGVSAAEVLPDALRVLHGALVRDRRAAVVREEERSVVPQHLHARCAVAGRVEHRQRTLQRAVRTGAVPARPARLSRPLLR